VILHPGPEDAPSKLAIVAGGLGVGIGFGLQNVVNNFVSGLILLFEQPTDEGDSIEVSGTAATMKHIGIRASVIRTFDGAEGIVPKGILLSDSVTNWTLSDRRRRIERNMIVDGSALPAFGCRESQLEIIGVEPPSITAA
jgi:small-conductance mechanosensitive channel